MSSGTAAVQQAPTPPASPDESQPTKHIRQLQDDLQVLVEHLANTPRKGAADPAVTATLASSMSLAVRSPESIIADPVLLEQLYGSIAQLTRLAAPANVNSIRLTRAFIQGGPSLHDPLSLARDAKRMRRWFVISASLGLLVFLVTVLLLIHVDRGRRIIQQLQAVQLATGAALRELNVARTAAAGAGAATLDCSGLDPAAKASIAQTGRSGADGPALCAQLQDALLRTRLVYREVELWNSTSSRLAYLSPISWVTPSTPLPADVSLQDWASTELRTSVLITAMTGSVLPMLLGLLGACVYVYREIDDSIRTATLAPREGLHGTVRMLLGAILGGLLGALWTTRGVIQLEGVPLSLGATAFFVGFSVEVVFSLLDMVVRTVAERIVKSSD
jgi:hypothetical protein